jgi:hypothetical protein
MKKVELNLKDGLSEGINDILFLNYSILTLLLE